MVQGATEADETIREARREGFNEKTSQVRWVFLGVALLAGAAYFAGAFDSDPTPPARGSHR